MLRCTYASGVEIRFAEPFKVDSSGNVWNFTVKRSDGTACLQFVRTLGEAGHTDRLTTSAGTVTFRHDKSGAAFQCPSGASNGPSTLVEDCPNDAGVRTTLPAIERMVGLPTYLSMRSGTTSHHVFACASP